MRPAPTQIQRDYLALAVFSSAVLIGAMSVASYDKPLIIGVGLLSVAIPTLYLFSQWDPKPQYFITNPAWVLCAPCALLGTSFVLGHVHVLHGLLFALTAIIVS